MYEDLRDVEIPIKQLRILQRMIQEEQLKKANKLIREWIALGDEIIDYDWRER